MLLAAAATAAPGLPSLWDDLHYAPAPWHPPVYAHAPIVKPIIAAPVIKPIIAAPVVKAYAPTSYATVTQLHVAHPQPIIKVFDDFMLFRVLFI